MMNGSTTILLIILIKSKNGWMLAWASGPVIMPIFRIFVQL